MEFAINKPDFDASEYSRKVLVHISAVGRIEEPAGIHAGSADGCKRQVHAVGSADDKEKKAEHKGTVVEAADTRVNPVMK